MAKSSVLLRRTFFYWIGILPWRTGFVLRRKAQGGNTSVPVGLTHAQARTPTTILRSPTQATTYKLYSNNGGSQSSNAIVQNGFTLHHQYQSHQGNHIDLQQRHAHQQQQQQERSLTRSRGSTEIAGPAPVTSPTFSHQSRGGILFRGSTDQSAMSPLMNRNQHVSFASSLATQVAFAAPSSQDLRTTLLMAQRRGISSTSIGDQQQRHGGLVSLLRPSGVDDDGDRCGT